MTPRFGPAVYDGGVRFSLWAPAQHRVTLVLHNGREVPMARDEEGFFTCDVPNVGAGQRYWFRTAQGLRPDPASRFQPDGPLGPSEIVDPRRFTWTDQNWGGAGPRHRQVLYEMHVGTFTVEGTWRAAVPQLESLADLGITTLEVMPVADFAGRFGWGYDGVNLFAPTRLYGTPDDLRRFVDEAHRVGLAVILDVVYNHFGPIGNFLPELSDTIHGPPGEWGASLNFDGPGSDPVRALIIENAAYWICDFHFDGLRLDATQAIRDRSREHIISALCRAARQAARPRRIFIVGESEPQQTALLAETGAYEDGLDALWNEDWHHAARVALTGRRRAYFSDYQGTAPEFASMARHGFLYQGQWYGWQRKPRGGFAIGLPSSRIVCFLENHDQVANTGSGLRLWQQVDPGRLRAMTALLLLGPALPMLFQGQEFASPRPFHYFADHDGELAKAVEAGRLDFLEQFPHLATEAAREMIPPPGDRDTFERCKLSDEDRREGTRWLALHRDLLRLRRDDEVLKHLGTPDVRTESSAPTSTVLLVRYIAAPGDRLLVVNLGDDHLSPMNDALFAPLPHTHWTLLWSSDHPQYGGPGVMPFAANGPWLIPAASAMLLQTTS